MEETNGTDDNHKPRDAELPLKDMRNWQLIPTANESPVKSTAVVKYSAVPRAASFAQLQCNTDLNLPPSNWLSSSAESYGLQHVPAHSTGFSSFRLAHMFLDCVGQVDVVSDAENIKKLLKIPYSRGVVSMMVHRVENTLLIDDFDVHKLLLQQSKSDWEWLREFLLSNVLQSMSIKDKGLVPNHRRSALQNRQLVSKFLHHSLAATDPPPPPPLLEPASKLPLSTKEPPLPEPQVTEELPDSGSTHRFLRNVVWNFEDLQMLLGTDMPIFGGSTHPCISLRLCDMAKPISVLTGIDYWLDNLMSNVPEVVMCFHLDGIVKRYELVKTEDLPYLSDSKFSAKHIRDVAQNILSFLKTNAAKAGHTYWLFKGKDDDVVKLYDLTSLCDNVDDKGQNPFTVPVAMLLYRVARNMKHSVESQHKRSTIAVLLENCVRLLDAQKYPQIVTSAHYMLSDLFIPATLDPAKPIFDDELDDEEREQGNQNLNYTTTNTFFNKKKGQPDSKSPRKKTSYSSLVPSSDSEESEDFIEPERKQLFKDYPRNSLTSVMALNILNSDSQPKSEAEDEEVPVFSKPPPLAASVPERCMLALKQVAVGLQCLQYFGQSEQKNGERQMPEEDDAPQMAKPFEPIPMPYIPLNKSEQKEQNGILTEKHIERHQEKQSKNKKNKNKNVRGSVNNDDVNKSDGIKNLLCPMPAGCMPTWQTPDANDNASWNTHLKTLLYEKACLVYATLAENDYASERFGRAVQMVGRVLRCREVLDRLLGPSKRPRRGLESYLLGRAGDCCFMLVQDWPKIDSHRRDLVSNTGVDAEIEHEMFRDCPDLDSIELSLLPERLESMEQMLKTGLACYKRGLELSPELVNFNRRIGNVHNELGCLYMSQAQAKYDDTVKKMQMSYARMDPLVKSAFRAKFDQSLEHLEKGLSSFEAVDDKANVALLYSNIGRLLRLCAHFYAPAGDDPKEHFFHERSFYNRSLSSYQSALDNLGQRKGHEDIWDAVVWELSTALYNMAVLAVESPAPHLKSADEAERVAVDLLHRALKYCDSETPGTRQPIYQYRAASIHHRLAALHHKSYRNTWNKDERHARAVLQSSRLHYEKACDMYTSLERPGEYLNAQIERIALAEFIAINATTPAARLRAYNAVLELHFSTMPMLQVLASRMDGSKGAGDMPMFFEETPAAEEEEIKRELGFLNLFEQRLQSNLLAATKTNVQCSKKEEVGASVYKTMYSLSLRTPVHITVENREAVTATAKHLCSVLQKISDVWRSANK